MDGRLGGIAGGLKLAGEGGAMTSEGTAEMGKIFPKIKIVSPQF
jgi:hypothetical protein